MASKPRVTQVTPKTATNPGQVPNFTAANPKPATLQEAFDAGVAVCKLRFNLP